MQKCEKTLFQTRVRLLYLSDTFFEKTIDKLMTILDKESYWICGLDDIVNQMISFKIDLQNRFFFRVSNVLVDKKWIEVSFQTWLEFLNYAWSMSERWYIDIGKDAEYVYTYEYVEAKGLAKRWRQNQAKRFERLAKITPNLEAEFSMLLL